MFRKLSCCAIAAISVLVLPVSKAQAGIVDYTLTSLGGGAYRYDYTINNPTPSLGFDELTIFFDVNSYELLSNPVAPAEWDPLAIQPDPGIPADGLYDAVSLGGLVGEGVTVRGFSVSFIYLGTGRPGAQPFDLLDSASFSVVHSGRTTPADAGQVPEPASIALLLIGSALILRRRRQPYGSAAS